MDAIVNAANNSLLGGGGVDGAIHRAAGTRAARRVPHASGLRHPGAPRSRAATPPGQDVIQSPSGRYGRVARKAAELLASCYRESLALALAHGAQHRLPRDRLRRLRLSVRAGDAHCGARVRAVRRGRAENRKIVFACLAPGCWRCTGSGTRKAVTWRAP